MVNGEMRGLWAGAGAWLSAVGAGPPQDIRLVLVIDVAGQYEEMVRQAVDVLKGVSIDHLIWIMSRMLREILTSLLRQ